MHDDVFFETRLKRFLDRLGEVVGSEMGPHASDPPPLDDTAKSDDPESIARRAVKRMNGKAIGPRTALVRAFIVAERTAQRPFPSLYQITEHMGWPQDGCHRQAKDALKRLSAAGKLPKFRTPKQ